MLFFPAVLPPCVFPCVAAAVSCPVLTPGVTGGEVGVAGETPTGGSGACRLELIRTNVTFLPCQRNFMRLSHFHSMPKIPLSPVFYKNAQIKLALASALGAEFNQNLVQKLDSQK